MEYSCRAVLCKFLLCSKLNQLYINLYPLFFLFFNGFMFNLRIIVLQYCVGFCHTSTWVSHRHTDVPSLPPPTSSHPSRHSQSTLFRFPSCLGRQRALSGVPLLHSRFSLVIYFTCSMRQDHKSYGKDLFLDSGVLNTPFLASLLSELLKVF